jgi:hypothetical protein
MIETIWTLIVIYTAASGSLTSDSVTTVEGYKDEATCLQAEAILRETLTDPAVTYYSAECIKTKRMVTPDSDGNA